MTLLLYGATGYTGRLAVEEALRAGLRPILAGRSEGAVRALAEAHGLPWRAAPLDDRAALDRLLADVRVVLHCAGPFSRTSRPMVDACVRHGVHYLDITGEISVFEACAARDAEAKQAGVMLFPGVGFDVVPSDCLAAHLKRRLPEAARLVLAFTGGTGVSRGTARTMLENIGAGGAVRRGGRIVRVPAGWRTRQVDFGERSRLTVTIPWGDVSTAFHSTGIPDIEVYTVASPGSIRGMRLSRWFGPLLGTAPVQRLLARLVDRQPPGPSADQRSRARAHLWGEVTAADGRVARARLVTPDGYTLTARTAIEAARRVLHGEAVAGFQTPSRAFGPDFILSIPDTTRVDLP